MKCKVKFVRSLRKLYLACRWAVNSAVFKQPKKRPCKKSTSDLAAVHRNYSLPQATSDRPENGKELLDEQQTAPGPYSGLWGQASGEGLPVQQLFPHPQPSHPPPLPSAETAWPSVAHRRLHVSEEQKDQKKWEEIRFSWRGSFPKQDLGPRAPELGFWPLLILALPEFILFPSGSSHLEIVSLLC